MTSGASPERIDAEEAVLGARLPTGLRKRLEEENGGSLWAGADEWTLYPVWDPSTRASARRTTGHLARQTSALREAFGDLFPAGAIAVAEDEVGDPLLILDQGTPVAWRKESGVLEPLDVDWSLKVSKRSAAYARDWLVDLLRGGRPGTEVGIEGPGTPFRVSFVFLDDEVAGEAVGLGRLPSLQRYHIATTMVRELADLGWARTDPAGESSWTHTWVGAEWDPRVVSKFVVDTFDRAYGLDARFLRAT